MLDSSFLAGTITSSVAGLQSKVGVGLVRSQPFNFPNRARTRLGDKNQYETEAMIAPLCRARITHRPVWPGCEKDWSVVSSKGGNLFVPKEGRKSGFLGQTTPSE